MHASDTMKQLRTLAWAEVWMPRLFSITQSCMRLIGPSRIWPDRNILQLVSCIQSLIQFFLVSLPVPNPCGTNNGGCSDLCLIALGGDSATCACPDHFVLASDGMTCHAQCTEAQFECGGNDPKCIPKAMECDGFRDCKSDEHAGCRELLCVLALCQLSIYNKHF